MSKVKKSVKKSNTPKTTTKVKTVTEVAVNNSKPKTPIYLKEGVTGKQMMRAIYKANNSIKAERSSFSRCLKDALEHGKKTNAFDNIRGFVEADCTPRRLMKYRSKHRIGKDKFSAYEVLMMIKKMYQEKA